jgi:hypothetical protein
MSCLTEPLLEPRRVARLLGVEVETLGVWRRRGYGPHWYRIGREIRYAEQDLQIWMSERASSLVAGRQVQVQAPVLRHEPSCTRSTEDQPARGKR